VFCSSWRCLNKMSDPRQDFATASISPSTVVFPYPSRNIFPPVRSVFVVKDLCMPPALALMARRAALALLKQPNDCLSQISTFPISRNNKLSNDLKKRPLSQLSFCTNVDQS